MTTIRGVGFEYPTILTPSSDVSGFEGWGVRIG